LRWSLRPPGRATLYRCDAAAARNPLRRCSRGRSRRGNDRSSFLECGVHENRCTTPSLQGGRRRTAERTRSRGTAVLVPGGACHASYHGLAWPFAPPRGPRSDVGTSSTPPHLPVTHPPCTATTNPPTCQVARCVDVAAPPRRAMAVGTTCGQGRAAIWVGGGVLQLYKCPNGLDRSRTAPSRARTTERHPNPQTVRTTF